jgi:tetratricopeptide (TPR) repeat protein
LQKFRQAIAENPRDAEIDLEFAHFLANVGKYPEAIGVYGDCLRLTANKEAAELGLAEAYRHVHNPDEARSFSSPPAPITLRARQSSVRHGNRSATGRGGVGAL